VSSKTDSKVLVQPAMAELARRPQDLDEIYRAIMTGEEWKQAPSDPELVSRLILERIMNAATFEEALAPQKLVAWREWGVGRAVRVLDFRLNPSTFPVSSRGGSSVYAVVDLVDVASGETETVTCGSRNVLVALVTMLAKGWIDRPVTLVSATSAEGYQVLRLEAVAEETVDAEVVEA
jgi:hypothetical protein